MDDTQQPTPPENPTPPDPTQQPPTLAPVVLPKNKLEELSPEIKFELDALFKRDLTPNKVKTTLEKKWLGQTDILPASYGTYKAYYELHRLRLHTERQAELKLLAQNQQELHELEGLTHDIAEGKDVEFRSKYQEILDSIEDRIAFVIEQQSHGFSSPQYETVLVQLAKIKKEILEKLENYKDTVNEQRHAQNLAYFHNYAYELGLAVINTYKKVNGDERLTEFRAEIKSEMGKIIERTKDNYNRDLNDL